MHCIPETSQYEEQLQVHSTAINAFSVIKQCHFDIYFNEPHVEWDVALISIQRF